MNVEDLITIAGKKLPVRFLFNLMELEGDLKGACHWATYLLYHAYDNKDGDLRCEVEHRLQSLGQPKYEYEVKGNYDSISTSLPEYGKLSQEQIYFALKCAISELMELKNEKDDYLFKNQNQWLAIFWSVVDLSIGIYAYQYDDFANLIEKLNMTNSRVRFVITSINDCTHTDYKDVPDQWVCTSKNSRGKNAFKRMKEIADQFRLLLEKHGLKRV